MTKGYGAQSDDHASPTVAYFSMEIGVHPRLATYSGGLGILAGDTLKAAADLGLPLCGVTLLHRQGYFRQRLNEAGIQHEEGVSLDLQGLTPVKERATVIISGRSVEIGAFRYDIHGIRGHVVPVYFLDADLPGNDDRDRALTGQLYGGDEGYRLRQEALLGLGGVAFLESIGLPWATKKNSSGRAIETYHLNEGHAALLTLALVKKGPGSLDAAMALAREHCVFTTHTPVPAGHDTFSVALAEEVLGAKDMAILGEIGACPSGRLNMSILALKLSRYVNGVAKRHGEVSRRMFPGVPIGAITNGVHAVSWTSDAIAALFDRHISGWRGDNTYLRYACELPLTELVAAHGQAKQSLFDTIYERTRQRLDPKICTVGFARRAAEYKRADLLFHDLDALRRLGKQRPFQVVFGGKAHPKDQGGKGVIERVHSASKALAADGVNVVYLEEYDMTLGRVVCAGTDVWLNTPLKPLEASGTSGMKAAINGVPSLSILDGWWVEGCIDGVTGWHIDDEADAYSPSPSQDRLRAVAAEALVTRLANDILPLWYDRPMAFAAVMRNAIALNGAYFNTHRMALQYWANAYRP